MDSIQSIVKTYILEQFLPDTNPDDLAPDTRLISGGILDSLATVKLVVFLEQQFGIVVDAHETDRFETIDLIAKLVQGKLPSGTS